MSIVLVGNTKSGRGIGRRLFDRFSKRLKDAGHRVTPVTLNDPDFPLDAHFDSDRFRGARAVIAIGGDGTVNAVTDAAIRTGTPVYHVPAGNENLVARRYGMDRDPETFLRALATHRVVHSDVGLAAGRRFLIMTGVGPDARVIERLHHARTKALGHLAYVEPVFRETLSPYLPTLSVTVDGRTIVDHRRGWLIIANDREYGGRLNFAQDAGPTTRSLSAVFLPAENILDCVTWCLRAWTRRHAADPRLIRAEGGEINVRTHGGGLLLQLDGEFDPDLASTFTNGEPGHEATTIALDSATLPILVPDPRRLPAAIPA